MKTTALVDPSSGIVVRQPLWPPFMPDMIIAQSSDQCSATVHPYPCMQHDNFSMFRNTEKGNDPMACKILVPLLPPLLLLLIHAPLNANYEGYVSVPSKSLTWFSAHLTKEKDFIGRRTQSRFHHYETASRIASFDRR